MKNKEQKKEFAIEMNKIAKVMRESKLGRAELIGVLDILKTDLMINSGCVVLNGKCLRDINKDAQR